MDVGPAELMIVLLIALLIFGGAKLPKLARSMGEAASEFRKGFGGHDADHDEPRLDDSDDDRDEGDEGAETPSDDDRATEPRASDSGTEPGPADPTTGPQSADTRNESAS